jgi:diguanylate cyclase (GGDEF)-like protein
MANMERLRLESANEELETLALFDALTGVANRRAFDQTLNDRWQRAIRRGSQLVLILLDVDHFKNFKDSLGHPAGDECLCQIARAMSGALMRPDDFLGRYGGEEFGIILPNTDLDGASVLASRIQESIQSAAIHHPNSPVGPLVSVSSGIAIGPTNSTNSMSQLISAADRALYQAKQNGRNRYQWASGAAREAG